MKRGAIVQHKGTKPVESPEIKVEHHPSTACVVAKKHPKGKVLNK